MRERARGKGRETGKKTALQDTILDGYRVKYACVRYTMDTFLIRYRLTGMTTRNERQRGRPWIGERQEKGKITALQDIIQDGIRVKYASDSA